MELFRKIALGLVILAFIMAVGVTVSPSSPTEAAGFQLMTIEPRHSVGQSTNATLADQLTATVSETIYPGSYASFHAQRSAGLGIYGHFDVGAGLLATFFICDQDNYELWTGGYTGSCYLLNEGVSGLEWTFRVPYTDTWYVVYFNQYYLYSSVHVTGHHYIDTTPPAVDWNIDDGATYSGTKEITATITEAKFDIAMVRLYIDDYLVDTEYDGSFSYSWNTAEAGDGSHTIRMETTDTVGNTGFLSAQVNVNNIGQYLPLIGLGAVGVIGLVIIGVVFRTRSRAHVEAPVAPVQYIASGPELVSQPEPMSRPQPQPPPVSQPQPQLKFCPYCGKPLAVTTARFCPECGSPIGQ